MEQLAPLIPFLLIPLIKSGAIRMYLFGMLTMGGIVLFVQGTVSPVLAGVVTGLSIVLAIHTQIKMRQQYSAALTEAVHAIDKKFRAMLLDNNSTTTQGDKPQ